MKWIAIIAAVTILLVLAKNDNIRARFFPAAAPESSELTKTEATPSESKAKEKKAPTNSGGSRLSEAEAASQMSLGASSR